jgi:hypothetical protein
MFHQTTAKSAEQAAKAVSAETQSAKKAAVAAPVPFSSEDNVPQEYSAPAPAQVSAPATQASAPTTGASAPTTTTEASAPVTPAAATGGFSNGDHLTLTTVSQLLC